MMFARVLRGKGPSSDFQPDASDVLTRAGQTAVGSFASDEHTSNRAEADHKRRLKLYHRPGVVAIIDDDVDFVEMLEDALKRLWNVQSFLSVHTFVNTLQQEPPKWEADFWAQQRVVDEWRLGAPLIPMILHYWATNPQRTQLTKVAIVDYLMPGMDGLEALSELTEWPGARLLLTGSFDENLATRAFNGGLIDHFIAKNARDLSDQLARALLALYTRPNERQYQIWASTLKPEQLALLRRDDVAIDLCKYVEGSFTEWVVIGDPFGVVGLTKSGEAFWLHLERADGLRALAELAKAQGATEAEFNKILTGEVLANVELNQSLGLRQLQLVPAQKVGDRGDLFAALTRIDYSSLSGGVLTPLWKALGHSENQSKF